MKKEFGPNALPVPSILFFYFIYFASKERKLHLVHKSGLLIKRLTGRGTATGFFYSDRFKINDHSFHRLQFHSIFKVAKCTSPFSLLA